MKGIESGSGEVVLSPTHHIPKSSNENDACSYVDGPCMLCDLYLTCYMSVHIIFYARFYFLSGGGSGWRQCAQLSCLNKPNKPSWPRDRAAAAARAGAGVFAEARKAIYSLKQTKVTSSKSNREIQKKSGSRDTPHGGQAASGIHKPIWRCLKLTTINITGVQ